MKKKQRNIKWKMNCGKLASFNNETYTKTSSNIVLFIFIFIVVCSVFSFRTPVVSSRISLTECGCAQRHSRQQQHSQFCSPLLHHPLSLSFSSP